MTLALDSHAKLNIGLRIIGRREDGYHLLQTLFQEIDFGDQLKATSQPTPEITLSVTGPAGRNLPADADNLCIRAAQLLQRKTGTGKGAEIQLAKHVPVSSGLGGGSSNAAATLRALNQLWEVNLAVPELEEIAAELGADVPFFIRGGLQLGEGIGELLTPLDKDLAYSIVVVMPPIQVSTAWAYGQLAGMTSRAMEQGLDELISKEPIPWDSICNEFEGIVFGQHPQLKATKEDLLQAGAEYASLSGSGSAIYGLFSDSQMAERAAADISTGEAILTRPCRDPNA